MADLRSLSMRTTETEGTAATGIVTIDVVAGARGLATVTRTCGA